MFEELVLDALAQLKFRILKKLVHQPPGTYTYNQLAEETNLSYQQFYKLVHELNEELLVAKLIQQPLILPNTGITTTNLTLTIDEYRCFLLETSLPFQLLRALLLEPELSLEEFCRKQFVSRSTLSRRAQPLLNYLRKYQITINFRQFDITGSELAIRLLFFYFFWIAYRNLYWPFRVTKAEANTYGEPFLRLSPLKKNFVGKLEVLIYSAIATTRIRQGKLASYNSDLDFLLENNPQFDLAVYDSLLPLSAEEAKGEAASVYFLANFLPFYESKKDPAIQQTIAAFTRQPNVVWDFANAFRDFVSEELHITLEEDTRKFMMANLANVMLAFYGFQGPFPNLPYLMKKPSIKSDDTLLLEEKIEHFLRDITSQDPFTVFRPSIRPLIQILRYGISSFYYEIVKDQPLRVGILVESNLMLVKPLVDFLQGINFIEVDYYKEKQTYDFIVTTFSKVDTSAITYNWDYNQGYQNMASLYTALREAYLIKNT